MRSHFDGQSAGEAADGQAMSGLSRRRFLKTSGLAAAGTVAGLAAVRAAHQDREDSAAYQYWRQKEKGGLSDQEYVVMCGVLAANPHNTQAWKFHVQPAGIQIFSDPARHLGAADPRRRLMVMGLGCAVENMAVAAGSLGYAATVDQLQPDAALRTEGGSLILRLDRTGTDRRHPWFDAIFSRQTTRRPFDTASVIPTSFRESLAAACALPGGGLAWRAGAAGDSLATLVQHSVRQFLSVDQRHRDGMKWFRRSRREWEEKRDGISMCTSDASLVVKEWVEWFATTEDVMGDSFKAGEIAFVDRTAPATPLWGLVWSGRSDPHACFHAGRAAEKVYLEAAARGYAVCPVSYPTELAEMAGGLREAFGLGADADPLFLFRLGKAPRLVRSVRRDLDAVMV
jgi:nitroreductase